MKVFIYWPSSNDVLKEIRMDGAVIWSASDEISPTSINSLEWIGSVTQRQINVYSFETMQFVFKRDAEIEWIQCDD